MISAKCLLVLLFVFHSFYTPLISVTAKTITINWNTGSTDLSTTITVETGDALIFNYITGYNVLEISNEADYTECNFNNSIQLSGVNGPYTYFFTSESVHYFGCSVGNYCANNGMHLKVIVKAPVPISSSSSGAAVARPSSSSRGFSSSSNKLVSSSSSPINGKSVSISSSASNVLRIVSSSSTGLANRVSSSGAAINTQSVPISGSRSSYSFFHFSNWGLILVISLVGTSALCCICQKYMAQTTTLINSARRKIPV